MWLIALTTFAFADAPTVDGDALRRATELPISAARVRELGTSTDQVREALQASRTSDADPGDTADMFKETADAVEEHGPVDNFGSFVRERLSEGLRGRELAASIRAEHQAHGKGRPDHAGAGGRGHSTDGAQPGGARGSETQDRAQSGGRADGAHGSPQAGGAHSGGRPDSAGGAQSGGRPDSAGGPQSGGRQSGDTPAHGDSTHERPTPTTEGTESGSTQSTERGRGMTRPERGNNR